MRHDDIIIHYIKTKNKIRKIVTYRSDDCLLRQKHEKIQLFLEDRFLPSIFSKGYVSGRSIYQNAMAHIYNDYFIMLDIKNFFPSICHKQLSEKIFREINLLVPNQINRKECNEIVDICSVNSRGIPLGFVTSPTLSNIYLKEFDNIFFGKLKKLELDNIIFTRYADDITISFKSDSTEKLKELENAVVSISSTLLSRYGLRINPKKTRSYSLNISNHVRVTGINITKDNDNKRKLTIGRSVKNKLYWDALACLDMNDIKKINHVKGMQSFILSVEKNGYEGCFSRNMINKINELGFSSLKQLIDELNNNKE